MHSTTVKILKYVINSLLPQRHHLVADCSWSGYQVFRLLWVIKVVRFKLLTTLFLRTQIVCDMTLSLDALL
jgi:hypothetical protein